MKNPRNVICLDQENGRIEAVVNGGPQQAFVPGTPLPAGGGLIVADGNTWSVRNPYSVSQYCWATQAALDAFLAQAAREGYEALTVANKLTNTLYLRYGLSQAEAVVALYRYVHEQVARPPLGALAPVQGSATATGALPCGCARHYSFDSGHAVRATGGDNSFGQRALVVRDFLRLQNTGGYDSDFCKDIITAAWAGLDKEQKKLFNLQARQAACPSPNRLMAVAVCTHDPATGELRRHGGRPWGKEFIIRRVIGLNGTMRGTGERAPGNPMRAVLRILGRRGGAKVNRTERAALDAAVRALIGVLQANGNVRPA